MIQTYLTFGLYLVVMLAIGAYFYKKASKDIDSYLLGGRGLGSWLRAIRQQRHERCS